MLIGDQPERAHGAVLDVHVLAHRELNVRLRVRLDPDLSASKLASFMS